MSAQNPRASWAAVNELFHRALEHPADSRGSFVAREAGPDDSLRDEVLALLSSHDRISGLLGGKAVDIDAVLAAATIDPLVGRRVGHYEVERVLGAGGMGVVYLARDLTLGRHVALKSLPREVLHDARARERLAHEARASASIGHPGIAVVYALEEIDGQVFIASEYIAGHTLREELESGPLSPSDAIATAMAIARALEAAHARGIVHRDLKPENIMRTESGIVKILDFGLARALQPGGASSLTTDGVRGTPAYMAPEQLRGARVTFTADIFAFGIVVYELVTGHNPFAGGSAASAIARILELAPAPLRDQVPAGTAYPEGLGDLGLIVHRCLEKDPTRRFASTGELVDALERLARGSPQRAGEGTWWWTFHQVAACAAYAGLLPALWFADERIGGTPGITLFLLALVAVIVSVTLRLHLWFAVRSFPEDRDRQRRTSAGWRRMADLLFVLALAVSGLSLLQASRPFALVLIGAAVVVFLASTVIEPATERAAFRPSGSS